MNELGQLLREAREELGRQLGREVGEGDVAAELRKRGIPMERKTYSNLETGRTKTIKPKVANALPDILPITVVKIVEALGFELAFEGIEGEEEPEMLLAYRSLEPLERKQLRGSLGLEVEMTRAEYLESLRRLAAMDRPGRRETLE